MKLLLSAVLAVGPAVAHACPVCAQDRPGTALFILAMIAAPYLVAITVIRVIRSKGDAP